MYASDYDNRVPIFCFAEYYQFGARIQPYMKNRDILRCRRRRFVRAQRKWCNATTASATI
jgi:hypothetical protein